jgi:PAS domain-containing protein
MSPPGKSFRVRMRRPGSNALQVGRRIRNPMVGAHAPSRGREHRPYGLPGKRLPGLHGPSRGSAARCMVASSAQPPRRSVRMLAAPARGAAPAALCLTVILSWSRACEEVTGRTLDEVRGTEFAGFVGPGPRRFEGPLPTREGTVRWINWATTAHTPTAGGAEELLAIGLDITSSRRRRTGSRSRRSSSPERPTSVSGRSSAGTAARRSSR